MTAQELPAAAQQFIDGTNAEDRETMLGAFTQDGEVVDFGRTFVGPAGIGGWSDRENIGTHNRISIQRVVESNGVFSAAITVTGKGYNGRGTFEFHLATSGRIQRLIITG